MTQTTEGQPHIESGSLRERLERHHFDASGWSLACCNHDRDLAHDVLHEAYVRVLDGRARYRAESSFKTWLFGVIRIVGLEVRRRDERRGVENSAEPAEVPPMDLALGSLEQVELVARLNEALTVLSRRQREVLHLVFYQSLTIEAAARVMEVGVGAARTHYHRAKTRLRKELSKESVR